MNTLIDTYERCLSQMERLIDMYEIALEKPDSERKSKLLKDIESSIYRIDNNIKEVWFLMTNISEN